MWAPRVVYSEWCYQDEHWQKDHMAKRLGLWATSYQHNIQGMKENIDRVSDTAKDLINHVYNETSIKSLHISRRDTPGIFSLVDTDLYPHCYNETAFVKYSTVSIFSESFQCIMNWRDRRNSQIWSQLARTVGVWESPNPSCCQVKADLWRSFMFFCEVWPKSG